jgi:hypothetical protein
MKSMRGNVTGVVALVVAVLIAIGIYWYASPYLALHGLKSAAQKGDVEAVAARVDIVSYRESLREQFAGKVSGVIGKSSSNPLSALGNLLGMAVATPVVEAMARPEAIMNTLRRGELTPLPGTASAVSTADPDMQWRYEREGANRFIAYPRAADAKPDDPSFGLVLQRQGFVDWKLVGVRLPQAAQ